MMFQIFSNYYLNGYVRYYEMYNIWAANWSCGLAFTSPSLRFCIIAHYTALNQPHGSARPPKILKPP